MANINAVPFPAYDQAYRFYGYIKSETTGNPIVAGLSGLAASISIDGAPFAASTNAPVEVGTNTGFFWIDLIAAEMLGSAIIVNVSASNGNAVNFINIIYPYMLTLPNSPNAAWYQQTPQRFETAILQAASYLLNTTQKNANTGAIVMYQPDGVTPALTCNYSNDPTSYLTTKGPLQ